MPSIWPMVHHHPAAARPRSSAMSPSRARVAAYAGASPAPPGAPLDASAITPSGGPRELGRREPCLSLVLDAEGVDSRSRRLGDREVRGHGVEHALEPDRLAGLDAEGHDVLDLEVDHVPDADAVTQTVVAHVDRRALHAQHLAHERSQRAHRPAELAAED